MKIFKKKKPEKKEEKDIQKDLTFIEVQKKKMEEQLSKLEPGTEEYDKVYNAYLKLQDSEIKEETLNGKKIENHNKSLEPEQKKAERKAGIVKTVTSAGAGVAAAILIPLTEQKIGPGMSKLSNHAQASIFKNKL